MTEEEFYRWKVENGWYTTGGDLLFILAFMLFIGIAVWLS